MTVLAIGMGEVFFKVNGGSVSGGSEQLVLLV